MSIEDFVKSNDQFSVAGISETEMLSIVQYLHELEPTFFECEDGLFSLLSAAENSASYTKGEAADVITGFLFAIRCFEVFEPQENGEE